MNLNIVIARTGFCARRKADVYIKEGKVSVNGEIVKTPWYDVKDTDSVRVGGKPVDIENQVYIIVNKPKGVITTLDDKFASRKIVDCIPKKYGRVFPVGRLDKDSRGLLILTNDGDLCYKLTHPKFEVEKEYLVLVNGVVDNTALKKLIKGVREGADLLKVKSCFVIKSKSGRSALKVIIHEGKKRHIRRLFEALGFSILDLKRQRIGRLYLRNLKEGSYRVLDKKMIYDLACSGKSAQPTRKGSALR